MLRHFLAALAALCMLGSAPARAEQPRAEAGDKAAQFSKLGWIKGPAREPVTGRATIDVPDHMLYLGSADTRRFLELTGNLPDDNLYTLAAPDLSWFAIFGFADSGYVKDNETIDPDGLLKTLRDSQAKDNEERGKHGLDPLTIQGWSVPPHYERATHNLEWGMRLASRDGENVNYTTRLLGRHGVMSATLVTDTGEAEKNLGRFRVALAGFHYVPDERYEAYKDGDKVAEYGLAALITGGAAAAVVKAGAAKGLFALIAAFGKYIVIAFAAAAAAFRRFFARLFGRGGSAE